MECQVLILQDTVQIAYIHMRAYAHCCIPGTLLHTWQRCDAQFPLNAGGDRGGVADLIASIKISKMPIVCVCNDKYKQSMRTLRNHCIELDWRKPTKQQVAGRLQVIARAEGLAINTVRTLSCCMHGCCLLKQSFALQKETLSN